jgi:crotonobetainyl-CoA:carnitine CoA-transferase CaiB-like acyl-CoA transferase
MTMLGHIRVVDLTRDLGSYAGVLLAEMGARVTQFGDSTLTDPAEREMALRGKILCDDAISIEGADIILRGPETFALVLPVTSSQIDVTILPFEPDGEHAARPASDLTLIARSGLAAIIGDPDRSPLTLPGRQAWALAGIQGAIASLVALNARASSGQGDRIIVSAYRSAVLANYREPLTWGWTGRVGSRTGNLLVRGKSGVQQVWECADGFVTWALVDNPPMMRATVAQMAADGLAGDLAEVDWESILVADMPRETLEAWEAQVEHWLATKTRAELTQLSNRMGMGMSAISGAEDIVADAHLEARGLWRDADIDGRRVRVPGALFRTEAS